MADTHLKFGVLKTSTGLDGILEVDVTEKIRLDLVKPTMKNNLRKAIRNGVAPVAHNGGGKLSGLYSILCQQFGMPMAYISMKSKGMYVEETTDEMYLELEAMHLITKDEEPKTTPGYYYNRMRNLTRYGSGTTQVYSTNITYLALCNTIAKHRPPDPDKVARALELINTGATISYNHNPIIA